MGIFERYAPFVQDFIYRSGWEALRAIQVAAGDAIFNTDENVLLSASTASGKTEAAFFPILTLFSEDPPSSVGAIYIGPLKALINDQFARLNDLCAEADIPVWHWHGDVAQSHKAKLLKNPSGILQITPESLEALLLHKHMDLVRLFGDLRFIVIDEVHALMRGDRGGQTLCLIERLSKLAGVNPRRIGLSATIGDPEGTGRFLAAGTGRGTVIPKLESKGARWRLSMEHFYITGPQAGGDGEAAAGALPIPEAPPDVMPEQAAPGMGYIFEHTRGKKCLIFVNSREECEAVTTTLRQYCEYRNEPDRFLIHHGNLSAAYRETAEAVMKDEEQYQTTVTTATLELGIDIGNLDLCILVGYPGTIMSTLQRGGRVGRKGQESAVILLAGEDALDQFFIHHPDEFFSRPPEKAVLNPENEVLLVRHLECAAAESPLRRGEELIRGETARRAVHELESRALLLRSADGESWLAARRRPHRDVELRGGGASFQIVDPAGEVIGSVDTHQALRETHPGAVYLHRGRSYVIKELDFGARRVRAVPEEVKWHTRVRSSKSTEILSVDEISRVFAAPAARGRLRVTEHITGYERRLNGTLRVLDIQPLDLPPQIFETEGLWFVIPERFRSRVEDELMHFMGAIHALEHVSIGLMPLLVLADRNDFGGISTPMHPQLGASAVFIYDGLPGGAGLTRGAFPLLERLFEADRDTLASCPCEAGCPSCTHSPKCGSGNRPIDKAGALFLISSLISGEYAPADDDLLKVEPAAEGSSPDREEDAFATEGSGPRERRESPRRIAEDTAGGAAGGRLEMPRLSMEEGRESAGSGKEGREGGCSAVPQRKGPVMVFDVETRRSAAEVGGWHRADLMGVSVAVLYDSKGDCFTEYEQEDLPALFERLREAGLVIGFNSSRFD